MTKDMFKHYALAGLLGAIAGAVLTPLVGIPTTMFVCFIIGMTYPQYKAPEQEKNNENNLPPSA